MMLASAATPDGDVAIFACQSLGSGVYSEEAAWHRGALESPRDAGRRPWLFEALQQLPAVVARLAADRNWERRGTKRCTRRGRHVTNALLNSI